MAELKGYTQESTQEAELGKIQEFDSAMQGYFDTVGETEGLTTAMFQHDLVVNQMEVEAEDLPENTNLTDKFLVFSSGRRELYS